VALYQQLDELLKERLVLAEIENLVEGKVLLSIKQILACDKTENVLFGACNEQIIKGSNLFYLSLLHHIEDVGTAFGRDLRLNRHIGGEVGKLSLLGEVELESLAYGGVWLETLVQTLHFFRSSHGDGALRNLVEESEILGLGRHIRDDHLALSEAVGHELIRNGLVFLVSCSLGWLGVSMNDHEIVL
jgi:hypothetical protein